MCWILTCVDDFFNVTLFAKMLKLCHAQLTSIKIVSGYFFVDNSGLQIVNLRIRPFANKHF